MAETKLESCPFEKPVGEYEIAEKPKLLCCPFCNGEATLYEDRHGNIICGYNVSCDDCCATIFADTEQEAVEMWNKRAKREW